MPNDRTVIYLSLAAACVIGIGTLLYATGVYVTPRASLTSQRSLTTPAVSTTAPAPPSEQAIALNCARRAARRAVDASPTALIARTPAEEFEVCMQQMRTIITTP